jgi:hypothetical protein
VKDFEVRDLGADAFWARFASRLNRVFFGFSSSSRSFYRLSTAPPHRSNEQVIRIGLLDPRASNGGVAFLSRQFNLTRVTVPSAEANRRSSSPSFVFIK